MKRFFYTILLILSCNAAFAQDPPFVPALVTNRFMAKTDLAGWAINNAINATIEGRVTQHLSLSLGFYSASRKYSQNYTSGQFATTSSVSTSLFNGDHKSISVPGKGIMNSNYVLIGFRQYLGSVIRAPFGGYIALNSAFGRASFGGTYGSNLFDKTYFSPDNGDLGPLINYSIFKVPMYKVMFGGGYQGLIFGHFYYDAGIYLDYSHFSTGNADNDKIISGITRNAASNLFSFRLTDSGIGGFTGMLNISYLIY